MKNNRYVLKVSAKGITYTNEFKIQFIADSNNGMSAKQIFEKASFDISILGDRRIKAASDRWRANFRKNGLSGLDDTRRNNSGRPRVKELTNEEILKKKDAEIAYLKAEIDLLKKLELSEREVENKLSSSAANPYKRIAKATTEHSVVKNKLNREFKQGIPGKVLLTDITYLPYSNSNMAYLSTIKDASTNEILAYNISDSLEISLVLDTVKKLVANKNINLHKDVFIHSDQGSNYTSPKFQKLLKKYKIGQSMSRRGNCWDNAPQESFFGHMKDEVNYKECTSLAEIKSSIRKYMHYYNNCRYQLNLKKLTPVQYRNQLLAA